MHLFGLTGGIASGKSAVAAHFRTRGLPVVDADVLAREVVAKGTEGLAELVAAFGPGVLGPDGELDRKAVAAIVFADATKRKILNGITHPRITMETMKRAQAYGEAGEPLVCYEAALIVENGGADMLRPLVVVAVSPEVQLARAMARDGSTEEEAKKRLDSQVPLADKLAAADIVVDNSGPFEALPDRADAALAEVCRRTNVDPNRYLAGRKKGAG